MAVTTLVDDLRAIRAIISSPDQWRQGEMGPGCCVAVAIAYVTNIWNPRWRAACQAIRQSAGIDDNSCIPAWNDALDTTHAKVLAAFDRAIAAAEAAHG